MTSRVYSGVNASKGPQWYDYESFKIEFSTPDRYEIVRRVGGGKYSEVFGGLDVENNEPCVIKVLKPVAPKKIRREIKILRNLTGGPNVVKLIDVCRDSSARYSSLVMEYIENVEWKQLFPRLTDTDTKFYLLQLLQALDFTHSQGVMHRDVKPGNVMIDHTKRQLRLIDWGLAEFYHPNTEYHIRVGSRYYKAPELLVGYKKYDYSLDMWSVGCMLASMIFRKEHFFRGSDNDDQLLKIMKVLGTEHFDVYLKTYGIHFETDLEPLLKNYPKQPWARFITPENQKNISVEALDLLDKLLRYDHRERLTAREAQAHPFFNTARLETTLTKDRLSDSGFSST